MSLGCLCSLLPWASAKSVCYGNHGGCKQARILHHCRVCGHGSMEVVEDDTESDNLRSWNHPVPESAVRGLLYLMRPHQTEDAQYKDFRFDSGDWIEYAREFEVPQDFRVKEPEQPVGLVLICIVAMGILAWYMSH